MSTQLYRDHPVIVSQDLDDGILEEVWTYFYDWLDALDITVQDAALYFLIDYADAKCLYTHLALPSIGKKTAAINAKKYDKMVAIYNAQYNPLENYDRSEASTHTRTPNLTNTRTPNLTTSSTTNTTTTSQINQTQTVTTTPTNFGTQTTRKVSPYDETGYKNAEQTDSIMQGTQDVATSYTGQPDSTTVNAGGSVGMTGTETNVETGTDTTTISSTIHGNIGVMSSQQMAEQELALAEKMAIFKTIERDLAAAILLQVW